MHEVMYNHKLHYDRQLATFLVDAKMALDDMRGTVWDVHTLAENEGITFDACLGLMLQVLNLLPQVPIDISFHTQIPLTIACCLESSVYRRWCPEQGGVSPLHKEIRASHTLSKVLPTNQVRVRVIPHLLLLLTTPQDLVGNQALDVDLIAMHKVSLLPAASDQVLQVQQPAAIPFISMLLKVARCRSVSLIPPKTREMVLRKRTMPRKVRAGLGPQVMSRRHPMVKISRSALTPRTPSPVLVSSLANTRTLTLSQTPGRKSSQHGKSGVRTALRRTAPRKTPVNHRLPRKGRQPTRLSVMGPGKKRS